MSAAYGSLPNNAQATFPLNNTSEASHLQSSGVALSYPNYQAASHHTNLQALGGTYQTSCDHASCSYPASSGQHASFCVNPALNVTSLYPTPTGHSVASSFPFSGLHAQSSHDHLIYGSSLAAQVPLTPASISSATDGSRHFLNHVSGIHSLGSYDTSRQAMTDCGHSNYNDPYSLKLATQVQLPPYQQNDSPSMSRHRVTTTLWEDEGTLCFQVDARGVCVARREDNNMINGTKLLNVVHMSRGKRDGILKNEKQRVVVKVGAMHLKGVWISFKRAKDLADLHGVSDLLYPLFEPDVQQFLYHPESCTRVASISKLAHERQDLRERPNSSLPNMLERNLSFSYGLPNFGSCQQQIDRGLPRGQSLTHSSIVETSKMAQSQASKQLSSKVISSGIGQSQSSSRPVSEADLAKSCTNLRNSDANAQMSTNATTAEDFARKHAQQGNALIGIASGTDTATYVQTVDVKSVTMSPTYCTGSLPTPISPNHLKTPSVAQPQHQSRETLRPQPAPSWHSMSAVCGATGQPFQDGRESPV